MPEDVALCRRCLADQGYIVVKAGLTPMPEFDLDSIPERFRTNELGAVLFVYEAVRAAQIEACTNREGGVPNA